MKKMPTRRGDLRYWLVLAGLLVMTPVGWAMAAGAGLVAAGAALHLWSKGCLRQHTELTVGGPYAWVRHPFYLANALVDAGILFLAGNPWLAAVVVPLWCSVYARTIRREERGLSALYGRAYQFYQSHVPSIIPYLGFIRWDPAQRFSWYNRNLRLGREAARLLRLLAYPLLFFYVAQLKQGHVADPSGLTALGAVVLFHSLAWMILWKRSGAAISVKFKGRAPHGWASR